MRVLVKMAGVLFGLSLSFSASAQVQLKNSLLYDLSLTPNLSAEFGLSPHWTVDLGYGLNPWTFSDNRKIRHWLFQPELRRWFCQRWDGSFLAFHLMGGEFNAGHVRLPLGLAPTLRHNRYEGWFAGAGIGYGYQWPVSRHFSVEAEVAVGYDYLKYRRYPCKDCGTKTGDGHYHYVGPTKIALNLIYSINSGNRSNSDYADYVTYSSYAPSAPSVADGASATLVGGDALVSHASLAATGGQMVLSMAVTLDSLHLAHAQTVVLRPLLRSADGLDSVRFRPLMVNSRDMHVVYQRGEHRAAYPDAIEVERRNGHDQTVSYLAQVPLQPWMDSYSLVIEEDLCGCGDQVADNVTPLIDYLPAPDALQLIALSDAEPSPVKPVRNLHGTAFINFVVDRWEMKPDYMDNRRELRKITDTLNIMVADHNISVDRILIHGWASPESPYDHNRMLAQNRAQSLTDYLRTFYRLPDEVFAPAEATPENWIGLLEALDTIPDAVLPHREEFRQTAKKVLADIARGVTSQADRDELALKARYRAEYDYVLQNVYPHLRRSDYEISFRVREFTLEEARHIYLTHPDQLSLYEFWQVAHTFPAYGDDYNRCMQTAFTYYPDSTVAALNVANAALRQGDTRRADVLLQRAGDSSEVLLARAVLAILGQRYDEATALLDQAELKSLGSAHRADLLANIDKNREAIRRLRR